MSRAIDLRGQSFGALTVIEPAPRELCPKNRTAWICICQCDKQCVVTTHDLRGGIRTSCGCRTAAAKKRRGFPEKVVHKDYAGVTYGELTGIKRLGNDLWLWRCSCGREKAIRPSLILNGSIQSCGHVLSETGRTKIFDQNVFEFKDGTCLTLIKSIVSGKKRSTNTSGVTGVSVRRTADGSLVYRARITFKGKEHNLGTFSTLDAAAKARKEAEGKYFVEAINEHTE